MRTIRIERADMKYARLLLTGLIASLVLAFSLLSLWASSSGEPAVASHGSTPGQVDFVSIDMDPTGVPANTATSLGSRETCISKNVGQQFDIDITIDEVDPADKIDGFQFNLNYDNTKLKVVAVNNLMLLAAGGATIPLDFSNPVPDTDGTFLVALADFSLNSESGEGVLSRITLENVGPGVSDLTLTNVIIVDADPPVREIPVNNIQNAIVAQNVPCPTPTPTPTPVPERTAVVFIQGLGSSLSEEEVQKIIADCRDDEAFGAIIQTLQDRNDSDKYSCNNILFFSYHLGFGGDSGFLLEGEWIPDSYDCTETGKPLADSGALLRSMLEQYRDFWEERGQEVNFILVGHSLGGLIAFQELLSLIDSSFNIERVITLDSPLEGRSQIPFRLALLAQLDPCFRRLVPSEAVNEIVARADDPDIDSKNQEIVGSATQTQVITLGNKNDCVYWLGWCFRRLDVQVEPGIPPKVTLTWIPLETGKYSDNTQTQLVENAAFEALYELGPDCAGFLECKFLVGKTHTIIRTSATCEKLPAGEEISCSQKIAEFIIEGP